jgi:hypothetical protein
MECWLLGYFAKFTLPISQVHFAKLRSLHCYFAMLTLPVCQVDFAQLWSLHIAQLSNPHCQVCKEPSLRFERAIQSGKERERGGEREGKEGGEGLSLGSLWKKKKWGAVWVMGKPEEFWHWTAQNFLNLWAGWNSFMQSTGWSGPDNWPCWCAVANLGMQAMQCGLDNWAYGLCNLANW